MILVGIVLMMFAIFCGLRFGPRRVRDAVSDIDGFRNPIVVGSWSLYSGTWGAVIFYTGIHPDFQQQAAFSWLLLGSLAVCAIGCIVGGFIWKRRHGLTDDDA